MVVPKVQCRRKVSTLRSIDLSGHDGAANDRSVAIVYEQSDAAFGDLNKGAAFPLPGTEIRGICCDGGHQIVGAPAIRIKVIITTVAGVDIGHFNYGWSRNRPGLRPHPTRRGQ